MSDISTITGSNIFSYNITPSGFTASQPGGKNLLVQNLPMDATEEEWKTEEVRRDRAKKYCYNKNLMLLKEAKLKAKDRVRKLYELAMNEPLEIDGVMWDARKESIGELIDVQTVLMNNGMPLVFNDAENKPHQFPYPTPKEGVPIPLVPIINKIALSVVPKIELKNKLYADIYAMTDIDKINSFNPVAEFNLSGIDAKYW